jgi:hypothetical protein
LVHQLESSSLAFNLFVSQVKELRRNLRLGRLYGPHIFALPEIGFMV